MPEKINFKIITSNDDRKKSNLKSLTHQGLMDWIDRQNLEAELAEEVKKMAGKYPNQALLNFKKNFQKHVGIARKKINAR